MNADSAPDRGSVQLSKRQGEGCINLSLLHWFSHLTPSFAVQWTAIWPPTPRPSPLTWAVSMPVDCCHALHRHHLLLLFSLKVDAYFTIPQTIEPKHCITVSSVMMFNNMHGQMVMIFDTVYTESFCIHCY